MLSEEEESKCSSIVINKNGLEMNMENEVLIEEYGELCGHASLWMTNSNNSITIMSYSQFGWIDKKV